MLKSYKIDGSAGEISNRLEDSIQENRKIPLREISFEELTNFIPKKDFLAETINGVKLEYLIKNEPSKSFVLSVNQATAIFHIFADRIITTFPLLFETKIFVDVIPKDIKVDIDSISSCFKFVGKDTTKIVFNSTAGVYFCTIGGTSHYQLPLGGAYFVKISIPSLLTGEQISSLTGNIYYYNGVKDYTNNAPQYLDTGNGSGTLKEYGTGFYLEGLNLKIGDIIKSETTNCVGSTLSYQDYNVEKLSVTFKVIRRLEGIKLKSPTGLDLIYPFTVKPSKIDIFRIIYGASSYRATNGDLIFDNNFSNFIIFFELEPIKIEGRALNTIFWKNVHVGSMAQKSLFDFNLNIMSQPYALSYAIGGSTFNGSSFEQYKGKDILARSCLPTYNTKILLISSSTTQTETQKIAPYTPYTLDGRLAVSSFNVVKMSKVGEYENFTIVGNDNPLETDPFEVIFQDIDEITFISSWSSGSEKGFVFGTTKELLYFSSLTNIFKKQIIDKKPIPCSYIPPLQFNINNITSNVIVEAGRKKITAIIPTKEQATNINLTQYINFFDNDPIKRIEKISYDQDQMLFVLTDARQLYGCLTGNSILAWFRIKLTYEIEDITTLDNGFTKKLFLTSKLIGIQGQKIIGSIDFTENVAQIKAEYWTDQSTQFDISQNEVAISEENSFLLQTQLTQEQKKDLIKPMVCKMTFHNQEIITSKVNTKQSRIKRRLSSARINVRESNNFKINYIYNDTNKPVFSKTVLEFNKIDDNLDIQPIKEFIEILKSSPSADNVKLSIETNANSTLPLKIQSIIFDTEYGNPK